MRRIALMFLLLLCAIAAAGAQQILQKGRPVPQKIVAGRPIRQKIGRYRLTPAGLRKARQTHAERLRQYDITDLSSLGRLTIAGTVVPQAGLLTPKVPWTTTTTSVRERRWKADGTLEIVTRAAVALPAVPLSSTPGANEIAYDRAYVAAEWLELRDDTKVMIKWPVRKIVFVADRIIVGRNVTITYEPENADPPKQPGKPEPPAQPDTPPSFNQGTKGTRGTDGVDGGPGGGPFQPAPEVEIWTLDLTGSPAFELSGQDGGAGGAGGDGGDGGPGGDGSAAVNGLIPWIDCAAGPGPGGDGGDGGRGGNGGRGGDGARGGALTLFMPAVELEEFERGFNVNVAGGHGGPGGAGGSKGNGGPPGNHGRVTSSCDDHDREKGNAGNPGEDGAPGPAGTAGTPSSDSPVKFNRITEAEFKSAWDQRPLIVSLVAARSRNGRAFEGEGVSIHGHRFTTADVVEVSSAGGEWIAAQTMAVSNELVQFVVPAVTGGMQSVRVRQTTGLISNEATIFIAATLARTEPARITPGATTRIIGTGFTTDMQVYVNGLHATPGGTRLVDAHTLEAEIVRPQFGVESNAAGERVELDVDLNGSRTNTIGAVFDTFVVASFGDSIMAGVGLGEQDTITALVADALRAQPGGRAVYARPLAHTGAIIGLTPFDAPGLAAVDRQVPTRYPTIYEQVMSYAAEPDGDAEAIDLILVDGGANDVDVDVWLEPKTPTDVIVASVEQASHQDMLALLEVIAGKFPNAKVVVAGNYAPISEYSDYKMIVPLVNAVFHSIWYHVPANVTANFGSEPEQRLIENCRTFSEQANQKLAQAVAEINEKLGGAPRFFFADPKFGPFNAAAAGGDSWLFGLTPIGDGVFVPQDAAHVAAARAIACESVGAPRTDVSACTRASAGHPNPDGARAYARAIVAALQ